MLKLSTLTNRRFEYYDITKSPNLITCDLLHREIEKINYTINGIEISSCPKCNNRIVISPREISLEECYYYHGYTNKVKIKC